MSTQAQPPQLNVGIYRHFEGNLYFAEKIIRNKTHEEWEVVYHPLYPDSENRGGYSREFPFGFIGIRHGPDGSTVTRFTLIQTLPVEKMQILLPGTQVQRAKNGLVETFDVTEVSSNTGKSVWVTIGNGRNSLGERVLSEILMCTQAIELSEFLETFQKSAG